MSMDIVDNDTGEIVESGFDVSKSLAVGLTRAEIDQQIASAHAYPRTLKRVASQIMNLATLDEDTAAECMYALPRGGKPIKGPSVRFAEILRQAYGNCRSAARVVHVDRAEKYVEAEGIFHDLETNSATSVRVRRRISGKDGRTYNDDMIVVTGNAACAIALRNATLSGIPKALWRRAYESVQSVIAGDVTTLSENREKAIQAFAVYGVTPDEIFAALGVDGNEDVTIDHIVTLRGMFSAIKNGEATVEEMFARQANTAEDKAAAERLKERVAAKKKDREGFSAAKGTVDASMSEASTGNSKKAPADAADHVSTEEKALQSTDSGDQESSVAAEALSGEGPASSDNASPPPHEEGGVVLSLPERINKALWDCESAEQIEVVYEEAFAEEVNQTLNDSGLDRSVFTDIVNAHRDSIAGKTSAEETQAKIRELVNSANLALKKSSGG
ncbi:hypothetical protein [Rhodobium gokarnense]|uniref:Uncharacterized protein n=1 Tax=Rhodobium gokarnense TaxID=364296 RepID=A0ABT3HH17_9HYPH|nr:hypothetical protein [Rhodobium gokarnense]MCW2309684.1 hypothetical protein [Rhodobium gokarnense]